jgi:hypothetical protein
MRRILVTPPEPPVSAEAAASGELPHWVEAAKRGGFEHVALLGSTRLRWERLLGEAPPADASGPHADDAFAAGALDASTDSDSQGHDEHADESSAGGDAAPVESAAAEAAPVEAAPEAPAEAAPADGVVVAHPSPALSAAQAPSEPKPLGPAGPVAKLRKGPPKEAPASRAELWRRLVFQAQTGRIDPAAMDAVGKALAERWGLASVECHCVAQAQGDRDVASFVRRVAAVPVPGDKVVFDFSCGPRSWVGLGVAAAHTVAAARAEVEVEDLVLERRDDGGPTSGKNLFPLIRSHGVLGEMRRGNYLPEVLEELKRDPRSQPLAPLYERLLRALEFGSPVETSRAARALVERAEQIRREKKQRAFDATDASFGPTVTALLADESWSKTELSLAREALRRRNSYLAASHVREALISCLLEAFDVAAGKAWFPARGPEGEGRVRPRDVASGYLSSKFARDVIPDLDFVWSHVGNPRAKYLLVGPVHQDPGLMRSAAEGLNKILHLAEQILSDGRLKALTEATPFEKLVEMAVSCGDARVRPLRPGRKGGRGGDDDDDGPDGGEGDVPETKESAEGAAPAAAPAAAPERGHDRGGRGGPPRGDRGPRPQGGGQGGPPRGDRPQGDRPPRGDGPPRGDRGPRPPREIRAHGGPPPMGGGGGGDGMERPRSVPIGGELKIEKVRGGLGNLGAALAQAGVVKAPAPKPAPKKVDAPSAETDGGGAAVPAEPTPPSAPAFDVGGPA